MRAPRQSVAALVVLALALGALAAAVASEQRVDDDLIWLLPYESGR